MEDVNQFYRDAIACGERLGPKVALDQGGAELLRRIHRAFADWPPNAGLTWVQGEMRDNSETDEIFREGARIGNFDRWQDVPPELFAAMPSAARYLDDAGLNFYWPALMSWELHYGPTYEWATPSERLEELSERLHPQNEEQSNVFSDYKLYIAGRHRSR